MGGIRGGHVKTMYDMIGLIVLVVVFIGIVLSRSFELKITHHRLKRLMIGVEFKDNSCTYYKEYTLTIAVVVIFITITFTN